MSHADEVSAIVTAIFGVIEENSSRGSPSPIEACYAAGHAASAVLPFDEGNLVKAACRQVADEYGDYAGGPVELEKVIDRIDWWLDRPVQLRHLRIERGMVR